MSRRKRSWETLTLLGEGWSAVENKIASKVRDEVATFCPFTLNRHELVRESVTDEVLSILIKAKEYKVATYDVSNGTIPFNMYLSFTVDFASYGCLVPNENHLGMSPALRKQVQEWHGNFMPILNKWMLVRHVANWFNTTPGVTVAAVRYYWPAMMALLHPDSPKLREMHMAGVGTHQKEPKGISLILPLCRETASTVTAGQLLTDVVESQSKFGVIANIKKHTWSYSDYTSRSHVIETVDMALQF